MGTRVIYMTLGGRCAAERTFTATVLSELSSELKVLRPLMTAEGLPPRSNSDAFMAVFELRTDWNTEQGMSEGVRNHGQTVSVQRNNQACSGQANSGQLTPSA